MAKLGGAPSILSMMSHGGLEKNTAYIGAVLKYALSYQRKPQLTETIGDLFVGRDKMEALKANYGRNWESHLPNATQSAINNVVITVMNPAGADINVTGAAMGVGSK